MFYFDAHLDLAMNAVEWNRDLTQPLTVLRDREAHLRDKPDRGRGTVCLPELRRAGAGLVVATQIARLEHQRYSPVFGWASPAQAWAMTQAQLAWYRAMEEMGELVQIRDRAALEAHLDRWPVSPPSAPSTATPAVAPTAVLPPGADAQPASGRRPIGYILSLEGADSLLTLGHLERAWNDGLRALGPAHYGPGVYANGTDATGGFNARGRELLGEMARLGLILDVTHLCDDCFWEALDLYSGPVWASHHNCRALVPHSRQLSDAMIRALVERDAAIGIAFDAWMIVPGWVRGSSTPEVAGATLDRLADHIDHLCQTAGSARHVGLGTDLDGAYGTEQTPVGIDSIADVPKLADVLDRRGYSEGDIDGIFHGNFLRFLRRVWRD